VTLLTLASSASKMIATLSPRPASTWRSRQLYEAFSVPSSNHLKYGALLSSSTLVKGFFQLISSRAWRAQKASWSASASAQSAL
jgi:hypothetical protein